MVYNVLLRGNEAIVSSVIYSIIVTKNKQHGTK